MMKRALVICALALGGAAEAAQPESHPPNSISICDAVDPLQCLSINPKGTISVVPYARPDMWWRASTPVLSRLSVIANSQRDGLRTFVASIQCEREDADATLAYHITLNDTAASIVGMPSPTKQATGSTNAVVFAPPLVVEPAGGALTLATSVVVTAAAICNVQGYFAP